MFDQLQERLSAIFDRLSGRGKITEGEVNEALREVRVALLEADVSLASAKGFVARIKERAIGANVLESLTPAQTILTIVHDELVQLLGPPTGSGASRLQFSDAPPSVIMLVGLQGSGKKRRRPQSWRFGSRSKGDVRSSSRPTSIGPPPSTSSKRSASRSRCRSTIAVRAIPSRSSKRASPRPNAWGSPRRSWTPPGACRSTSR